MIKHVVMWTFRDEVTDAEKEEMTRQLEALVETVPMLLALEVGRDISNGPASMDLVLYSTFKSLEDLAAYAIHPAHLKVVEFVKPLVSKRAVVDYSI